MVLPILMLFRFGICSLADIGLNQNASIVIRIGKRLLNQSCLYIRHSFTVVLLVDSKYLIEGRSRIQARDPHCHQVLPFVCLVSMINTLEAPQTIQAYYSCCFNAVIYSRTGPSPVFFSYTRTFLCGNHIMMSW